MECGDMNNLRGVYHGRAASAHGTPRKHPSYGLTVGTPRAIGTPRSQTTSTSALATPRGLSAAFGSMGEEFGGQIPPWTAGESLSPRARQSPRVGRRLMLASRDKESLLEEIMQLKKALLEQSNMIRLKNAQHHRVGIRNRKLEMDVEDLETSLQLEGPRTGSPHRLRAKLQGLQMTVEELQDTCDSQREELVRLRRDIRITRTREIEVERDVFAGEIRRLQKVLNRMQHLQNRISCENRDLGRFKNKYQQLEIANLRLESCITAKAIRPQSQPSTIRKRVQYENQGHPVSSERGHFQGSRSGQQQPNLK